MPFPRHSCLSFVIPAEAGIQTKTLRYSGERNQWRSIHLPPLPDPLPPGERGSKHHEVLLGAVPMEDMDLVISPGRREVTVDPASPNLPHVRVK